MIEAVIFDMDGVLVDSEPQWFRARVELLALHGETWTERDQLAMAGVHTDVWVEALHEKLRGALSRQQVLEEIVSRMVTYYAHGEVPILPGAPVAVPACADRFRVGLASGSPRRLIDACLTGVGWTEHFESVISSDALEHGKPSPDVYLEIMRRMGIDAAATVVVEDSGAGIKAGKAAGAKVVAVPNQHTDPGAEVLALADARIETLHELIGAIEGL